MKRAEQLALVGLVGLLVIAGILLAGGVMYSVTAFWVGMMVVLGQALVVGLAMWGLKLARQAKELDELSGTDARDYRTTINEESARGPRGSSVGAIAGSVVGHVVGGHLGGMIGSMAGAAMGESGGGNYSDRVQTRTLETGFQRLVVGISAFVLLIMASLSAYLIYIVYSWARLNPDKPFPIAGALDKPILVDELGLVIGLGAAGIYVVLYFMTRVRRETVSYGEAVDSNFSLGVGGMAALGVASVLGYFRVPYASEVAAAVMVGLLVLQGLELLINTMKSYSGIEELDQEAVDLQALPLVPMLSSVWLNGLKSLFAQSFGLAGVGSGGVIARMMPRVIGAVIVIGILVSCFREVRPGQVAVLERLGYAEISADGKTVALLQPGLHVMFPWPIDKLVYIPVADLQVANVGRELHAPPGMEKVDFSFWTWGANPDSPEERDSQFVTGDPGSPQMLETHVAILWRVADAAKFYNRLSHSDFYEKKEGGTSALPVYDALVQETASFAVTRTFAIHPLDTIMLNDRKEVEEHCKRILQDKLNEAGCGIEIEDLTIEDLHPPMGFADQPDYQMPDRVRRGPASAYENVVTQRELKDAAIDWAERDQIGITKQAEGDAKSEINRASGYRDSKIATAEGEAARMTTMLEGLDAKTPEERRFYLMLAKLQTKYISLKDALAPVNKIVVDPRVKDVQLYQTTERSSAGALARPPG